MTSVHLATSMIADYDSQASLVTAMMDPAFYPKPPPVVTREETHISHLFFAGDLVYKVKKAVRFSFLDFSTLAKRRHYLQRELQLNRRLAPSVYLGVLPIALDESGWRLGGWAEPAEYTLVMRRLPEKRMLPFLLSTNQVTPEMMAELAKLLADFHANAEIVADIDPNAYLSSVEKYWYENVADLEPYARAGSDREGLEVIKKFGAEFLNAHKDLLARRIIQGWIRDVHGDLHAEHICFAPDGIQIFDCIEFSKQLRRCDLAAEVGFLLMDLRARGGEYLVEPFLARYRERINDSDMAKLLPFFECYRALVRAKVHVLRARSWSDDAARYFRFARRLTWEAFEPFLVVVFGLTGSGKSTLCRALAERLGLTVINSDVVRKQIAGKSGRHVAPVNEGIYSSRMTEQTYAEMVRQAEKLVLAGKGALLDATFIRRQQREKITELAKKYKIALLMIHCSAPDTITQSRLRRRAAEGVDISDGRWDIYVAQKAAAEALDEIELRHCLELRTGSALEQLVSRCEIFLRSRLSQEESRTFP